MRRFYFHIPILTVSQIVHLYMPKTLENYSQEIGRAGRDGFPSTCLMFLCAADIPVLEGFARGDTCSKKDLKLWLQELVANTPDDDNTLNFNLYQQSKTCVLALTHGDADILVHSDMI